MQTLLTVIIPLYNEERNIKSCIDLLVMQSDQNFNVIFINDGSIDNTVNMLKEIVSNYKIEFNYRLIEQKNQGAAAARENGIKNSDTEYVMILGLVEN